MRRSRDLLVVISSYHVDGKIGECLTILQIYQSIFHNVRQDFTEPVLADDSSSFQVQLSWGPTIVHSGLARVYVAYIGSCILALGLLLTR